MMGDGNIKSPYTGRDFVQFGKTKSVLNKGAQEDALLFNPPLVLSLEIVPNSVQYQQATPLDSHGIKTHMSEDS